MEQLEKIAPTVSIDHLQGSAPRIYRKLAQLTGTQPRLLILERRYQAQIAQLKAMVDTQNIVVSVIQANNGKVTVHHAYHALGRVLRDAGFRNGTIVARNEHTGRQLAELYGFHWAADIRDVHAQLLLNATPIGMPGGPEAEELAYTPEQIAAADVIFEVVASSGGTPLIRAAREQHKRLITGEEVFAL